MPYDFCPILKMSNKTNSYWYEHKQRRKEEGAFYSQLQTLREKSDYNCTYYATKEDTEPRIALTETFIEKVIGLIQ